jgi:heme oxygenase (biliverdin-IX-beta and delta-forming)
LISRSGAVFVSDQFHRDQGIVMAAEDPDRGAEARHLIRGRDHAALATSLDGHPYVSLVAVACGTDATPLLLLSDLAQHTSNLAADPRVSLLYADSTGHDDPLAGARLSLLGRAERLDDPAAAARFAARHPASAVYAGFADFHLYGVVPERGHLVAGFGRIFWVAGEDLRFRGDGAALAAAETEIVAHMNDDHAEAVALYAARLLRRQGAGWRMTGIDPEGLDLRRKGEIARLDFAAPVLTPAAARRVLVELAERARQTAAKR